MDPRRVPLPLGPSSSAHTIILNIDGGQAMVSWIDRATFRSLRRSPGFTVTAVLSLALAVALTTTTYGVVDSVRHPHAPYADPDRLYYPHFAGEGASGEWPEREMRSALTNQTHFYEA